MALPEINNRKAFHNYKVIEKYEAGLVLKGTEVKSARLGNVQFTDAYAREENGEVFVLNLHIAAYEFGGYSNHVEDRPKKLLLKKGEIRRLSAATQQKGYSLIPLRLYFKHSLLKCELGLCVGKKAFDKRETIRDRESRRTLSRALKNRK
jgi:SsrA-binding protein